MKSLSRFVHNSSVIEFTYLNIFDDELSDFKSQITYENWLALMEINTLMMESLILKEDSNEYTGFFHEIKKKNVIITNRTLPVKGNAVALPSKKSHKALM